MNDKTNKLNPDFSHRMHGHTGDDALDEMLNTLNIMIERASGLLDVAIDHIYSEEKHSIVLYVARAELEDMDAVINAFDRPTVQTTAE